MARGYDRIGLGGLIAAGLFVASCRGCLADDLTIDEGSGGAPNTSSPSSGPLASSGTGSTPDASSSVSGTDTSSAAESVSTGTGPTGSSSSSSGSGQPCPGGVGPDDFDDGPNACWIHVNEEAGLTTPPIVDEDGWLVVTPEANTGWWGTSTTDDVGWFMYQLARVDFVVSVDVDVNTDEEDTYQMAGLLLRDPRSDLGGDGDEAWVKWELGYRETSYATLAGANRGGDAAPFHLDAGEPNITGETVGRLGICKFGSTVHLAFRPLSGSFAVEQTFDIGSPYPDFGYSPDDNGEEHIQVGLIANAYDTEASLTARFDNFRISPAGDFVDDLGDCVANLTQQSQ